MDLMLETEDLFNFEGKSGRTDPLFMVIRVSINSASSLLCRVTILYGKKPPIDLLVLSLPTAGGLLL